MKHKHAELIKAWADGAVIQHKCDLGWMDVAQNNPHWLPNTDYRIKPEEKKLVVRWLWTFEADVKTWEQYTLFMTEEEARKRLFPKFNCKRLDWSRTEFEE